VSSEQFLTYFYTFIKYFRNLEEKTYPIKTNTKDKSITHDSPLHFLLLGSFSALLQNKEEKE